MSDEEATTKAESGAAPPAIAAQPAAGGTELASSPSRTAAAPPSIAPAPVGSGPTVASSPSRVGAAPPSIAPALVGSGPTVASSPSRVGAAATSSSPSRIGAATAPPAPAASGGVPPGRRWPSFVPSEAETQAILTGAAPPPPELASFASGDDAAGRLSELERAALRGEPVPVHPGALAKIALVRWRLAAAAHLRPRQPSPDVDAEAVDALLVEADEGLTVLRALEESAQDEGVKLHLDQAKEALAALAVELASALQATTKTEVHEAVQSSRKKYEPVTKKVEAAKPLAFAPARARARVGERWPWVLLSATVCAAIAYHAYRHFSHVPRPVPEGPVRGSVRLPSTPDGATVFRAATEGSIAENDIVELSLRLNPAGKEVVKIGRDKYAILPLEAARALRDAQQGKKP